MPIEKLKAFLDEKGVKYTSIQHSRAFTAQEIAELAHVPGKELAKTVMVTIAGELAMAVIPASHRVDFKALAGVAGASVELADEGDFVENLYSMDVYVSDALIDDEFIAFSAGTHSEVIRLRYADYSQWVDPVVGRFSYRFP
jgi:Ala-tRNA(Pro) deacylase